MIQRLYRLLLLFCSIAVFAACSDSDGNDNNGGNGGEIVPDGGDTYGYVTDANGNPVPGGCRQRRLHLHADRRRGPVCADPQRGIGLRLLLPAFGLQGQHAQDLQTAQVLHQTQTGNRPLRLHADGAGRSRNPVRSDLHSATPRSTRRRTPSGSSAKRPRTSGSIPPRPTSRATPSTSATW